VPARSLRAIVVRDRRTPGVVSSSTKATCPGRAIARTRSCGRPGR